VTLRVLIVDDETAARSELRHLLGAYDVEVAGEAASATEALIAIRASAPDAIFLDIEMATGSGIELARVLRDRVPPPAVVFVTAHVRYAVDAFAVEAFDYLLKPVDPARRRSRIPVVAGGRTELVEPEQVDYAQAEGDYSRIYTYDRAYLSTTSLHDLEEASPGDRFVRIHRSYLVTWRRWQLCGASAAYH
jgi:DNA-binding LytR/AlgR family response regulator